MYFPCRVLLQYVPVLLYVEPCDTVPHGPCQPTTEPFSHSLSGMSSLQWRRDSSKAARTESVTGYFRDGSDTGKAADITGCYGEGALNGRYTAAASYRGGGKTPDTERTSVSILVAPRFRRSTKVTAPRAPTELSAELRKI